MFTHRRGQTPHLVTRCLQYRMVHLHVEEWSEELLAPALLCHKEPARASKALWRSNTMILSTNEIQASTFLDQSEWTRLPIVLETSRNKVRCLALASPPALAVCKHCKPSPSTNNTFNYSLVVKYRNVNLILIGLSKLFSHSTLYTDRTQALLLLYSY